MSVQIAIILATIAAVFTSLREGDAPPQSPIAWARIVLYWLLTVLLAFEMAAGALWDLLNMGYSGIDLGYPPYFGYIIGAWKIPCALALLAPRFPRVKEWAYAGAFFNYTGAAASWFLRGDGPNRWAFPLMFAAFTVGSWALRPATRRLGKAISTEQPGALTWLVPALITIALLAVGFVTAPRGAPMP
jgi:hypothetical protein